MANNGGVNGLGIPKLNIPTASEVRTTIENSNEELKDNFSSNLKEEARKLGIPVVFNGTPEDIGDKIKKLPPTHSLREIYDILENHIKGGIYVIANNKQISQIREDLKLTLGDKRAIYVEYKPVDTTPAFIEIHNISPEKTDELYESILKPLLNITEQNNTGNNGMFQQIPPVVEIVNNLYELAKKINIYKLYKEDKRIDIPEDIKDIEKLLSVFEKLGDFSFVINLINPLYAEQNDKIKIEIKIAEIARAFENTPFTFIVSEIDIKDNQGIKPHSWGEEIKQITLDLPTFEKYKNVILGTFEKLENKGIKEGFKKYCEENPEYLDEIANMSAGLYLPDLKEHILLYSKSHDKFDPKEFEDSFYKYKLEAIKRLEALQIIEEKISFDDIGGLEALKNDFLQTLKIITDKKGKGLKRTYLLTGIPGSGKSFIAKSLHTEFEKQSGKKWIGLRFNISALFDKFVGQTEKNFAEVVKIIDSLIESVDGRVILWIDELEKALGGYSSHETSEKLKGEILTALEDKWGKKILVVATVNDFSKLAPELISRFANRYFFDTPKEETRKRIISLKLKKEGWNLSDEEIDELVKATEGFVGREFDDLFSNVKKKFYFIIEKLVKDLKLTYEEVKSKSPSFNLIKNEVDTMKSTIQDVTQADRIAIYRQLKGKYLDPDENLFSGNDNSNEGDLLDFIN